MVNLSYKTERLLSPDPDNRVGSESNPDIRSHPFFDNTDWHQIHSLSMDAPIITTTRDRKKSSFQPAVNLF